MTLNTKQIDALSPREKAFRVSDGHGLCLLVHPNGGKYWRQRYRRPTNGKAADLALGRYPVISLKDARARSMEARRELEHGIDPGQKRKAAKLARANASSFKAIATEFIEMKEQSQGKGGWTPGHARRNRERLEKHVYPWIGDYPIMDLTPTVLVPVLQRIQEAGTYETAHRVKFLIGQVCRYAIPTGRAESDPTRDLKDLLVSHRTVSFGAITDPEQLGRMLLAADAYQGDYRTRCALKLAPLVFVRPGELRHAKWSHIDFEAAEWRFQVSKTHQDHIVPLSRQALEIIEDLRPLTETQSEYLFSSARSDQRPMSNNTINAALRRLGYTSDEATAHGFRATARTMLDELLDFRVELIEMQLSHSVRDVHGRAYNRTKFLPQRRQMMQDWADHLDRLRTAAQPE